MSNAVTTAPETTRRVLLVLSDEQLDSMRDQLRSMERPGVHFVHESSPDDAFALFDEVHPDMLMVGMDLEEMEGLEFLAILLNKNPTFAGSMVVLPEPGDPFPPMVQSRDPESKRSKTEETNLSAIAQMVEDLAPPRVDLPKPSPMGSSKPRPSIFDKKTSPHGIERPKIHTDRAPPPDALLEAQLSALREEGRENPTPAEGIERVHEMIADAISKLDKLPTSRAPASGLEQEVSQNPPSPPALPVAPNPPEVVSKVPPPTATGAASAGARDDTPTSRTGERERPGPPNEPAQAKRVADGEPGAKPAPLSGPGYRPPAPGTFQMDAGDSDEREEPALEAGEIEPTEKTPTEAAEESATGERTSASANEDGSSADGSSEAASKLDDLVESAEGDVVDDAGVPLTGSLSPKAPREDTPTIQEESPPPSASPVATSGPAPDSSRFNRMILAIFVLVALLVGVLVYLSIDPDEAPAPEEGASAPSMPGSAALNPGGATPAASVGESPTRGSAAPGGDSTSDDPGPETGEGTPTVAAEESAPSAGPSAEDGTDVRQPVRLPLRFTRGSNRFEVTDSANLMAIVREARATLEAQPGARLEVGGHTSTEGEVSVNLNLGWARAEAARDLLVARGLPSDRLVLRNHGPARPLLDEDTTEARELNRRVTVKLIR